MVFLNVFLGNLVVNFSFVWLYTICTVRINRTFRDKNSINIVCRCKGGFRRSSLN